MPNLASLPWAIVVAIFVFAEASHAGLINLKEAPYEAVGDGKADDRHALARALSAAKPGDSVLVPPGDYRIVLTKDVPVVPSGVTLWGQGGKSRFLLTSSGSDKEHREFLRLTKEVTLEGLTIERDGKFPTVLLPISGDVSKVSLRNVCIIGHAGRFPGPYCHAIQVGNGTLRDLALHGVEVEGCTYGLFQSNEATGTVEGIRVDRCRFKQNTASDLEFNSPRGTMRDIVVRDCIFRDNRSNTPAGGFAVGFANVKNARVENCHISNYGSEALHVEDRSAEIHLVGNTIIGGSMKQPNGVIMVVNNSQKVTVERNIIDARPNANRTHLILVTAGGSQFAPPSDVVITGNVLIHGAATQKWYLQPGSGPAPVNNSVIEAGPATKP